MTYKIYFTFQFEVNIDEGWVSEGECFYHSGKLYPTRTSHEYSCCHGASNSDACKFNERHVHEENRMDFTGYDRLAALKKVNDNQGRERAPGVFALDCEMVYTVIGFELARVTIIGESRKNNILMIDYR
jgi:RNA exonuclease 1